MIIELGTVLLATALTFEMVLVMVILAATVVMFVTEVVRIDVTAILVLVVIGITGLIEAEEVLTGFSSNAVVAIIAVMILGEALDRVGLMRRVATVLLDLGGKSEQRIGSLLSGTAAAISGFIQNVGVAALFLPVTERLAIRTQTPASRLLMPMGFAALAGGSITLVASGSMILLNDLLEASAATLDIEIEPFGLFSPAPVGIALAVAGVALFALFGKKLLPAVDPKRDPRLAMAEVAKRYGLDRTIKPYMVPKTSPLVGRRIGDIEAEPRDVLLVAIHDGEGMTVAPDRDYQVRAGMVVGLVGPDDALEQFVDEFGLRDVEGDPFALLHDPEHAGLAEVVVRPGSDAVGTTVGQLRFRDDFGVNVLAVFRRGAIFMEDLRDERLAAGDVLVLFAPWRRVGHLTREESFVPLSDYPTEPPRTHKQWWAIGAFALAMGLVIFTDLQLAVALLVGVVVILFSRTLSPNEAYRSVSWKTVFLLAGLIPLGQAVEQTGTAAWIAELVVGATQGLPLWGIQLTIAVLTTAFTLTISNVGAAVLLIPLATNVAVGVDADPAQFGMLVAIAASNSFLIPTHQVNALLMGPGGYDVTDFLRAGAAMSVVYLAVLVVTINLFV